MAKPLLVVSLIAGLLVAGTPAGAGALADPFAAVWAVNDGEKVDRDDLHNPNKHANSAWDGRNITIFAARNEVVSFQVIVESGRDGARNLTARLPELRRAGDPSSVISYAAPANDPTQYAGRNIQVFAESYMDVTKETHADWIYEPGSAAVPPDPLGPTPVQLVPENATQGGFPLSVPAKSSQAVWFDVYVPRAQRSGTYFGEVTVSADRQVRRIPVRLQVFDFALPDENSLTAMVYYEPEQVERYQGRNLDPAYHRFAHRNRVEFTHGYDIPAATAARTRFTGADFTPANGYQGPGEGVGNTLVPRSFYGPGQDFDTPEEVAVNAKPWSDWLSANLPGKKTFLYMPDEPSPAQFDHIRSLGEAVHRSGAALPVFVTHGYDATLDGPNRAIDIWGVVANQYDIAKATQLRAEGRDMVPYNGQRPNVGSVLIDSPATDPRATMWAAFKHGVQRYFYWHANHWRHNSQASPTWNRDQNVWAEPITYNNKNGWYANGDGVLTYPGQEVLHPDQDRGIAGPIGSIQLANMRRGLQDHLYLTMARQLGLNSLVDSLVQRTVPKVYSDTTTDRPVSFPQSGNEYEKARAVLAVAIQHALKHKWKLVRSEGFDKPLNVDAAPWTRDPHGEQSPWNVDDLDDDGKYFEVLGGEDFKRHLASFDLLRKRVPFGQSGWLTAEVAARDKDKDGKPDSPPSVRSVRLADGPAAVLTEPSHDSGVILRSTQPLPPQYRIEATLKSVDFGGQRDGQWNYHNKINGYDDKGCKTNFPWKRRLDFSGPSDGCNPKFNQVRGANGYYFLSIMDYANPAPHNNVFIHTHRKVGMDAYNVSDTNEAGQYAVCNPATRQTYNYNEGAGNGINALFFAGERYQNPFIGYNAFDMQTECGTFDQETPPNHAIVSAAEIQPELMPKQDYTFAIERLADGYVMEMTGTFKHIGHKTLRYFRPFVSPDGKQAIWHYNNKPDQYDGRFNTSLVFGDRTDPQHQYVHENMWPAGSAYPDYFILGDPHLNYYEGSAAVTDIRLYVPR